MIRFLAVCLGVLTMVGHPRVDAGGPAKVPVILDTDVGSDVDDAFALALALASPELDVRAVTTVGGQADDRAWIVCRFLTHGGFGPLPVAFGRPPQPDLAVDWQ